MEKDYLFEMLKNQYNLQDVENIIQGLEKKKKVTFRINALKTNSFDVERNLKENSIEFEKVPWYDHAYIIKNVDENFIRKMEIYKNGEIYLQSLSSMIPAIILDPKENENILDMTAAPGGKTTQIAALSCNKALITACEKNKIRYDRLKYNIEKQSARVNVLCEDARVLDDFFSFDKILLDTPCSGSGTLDLNTDISRKFSKELVDRSIKTQEILFKKDVKILKKGHEMVFSTCSILKNENETNLKKAIDKKIVEVVPINLDMFSNIPTIQNGIQGTITICPNENYEGFFVARLRKI